ncbi:MAG: hypothetical protein JXA14_15375 [Anaerolineae bacterium]|nr:hypothetical protein [Anaerolineae bacterium]
MKQQTVSLLLISVLAATFCSACCQSKPPPETSWVEVPSEPSFVQGNYAYIPIDFQRLVVIDISDPTSPKQVGHLDLPYEIRDICVAGDYAYVAVHDFSSTEGLLAIDISNPSAPSEAGFIEAPFALAATVANEHVYLLSSNSLFIIDISHPGAPLSVGSIQLEHPTSDMVVSGDYVYTVFGSWGGLRFGTTGWLQIVDVSIPSTPTQIGSFEGSRMRDIAAHDGYVYIVGGFYGGYLEVRDILSSASPLCEIHFEAEAVSGIRDITIADDHAYLTNSTMLYVVDISNPKAPKEVLSVTHDLWTPDEIVKAGNFVYAYYENEMVRPCDEDEVGGILQIIDVSDPTASVRITNLIIPCVDS